MPVSALPAATGPTGPLPAGSVTVGAPPGVPVMVLPGWAVPQMPISVDVAFTGKGALSVAIVAGDSYLMDFDADTTLELQIIEHDQRHPQFGAVGVLSVVVIERYSLAVDFDGVGVLSASVFSSEDAIPVDVYFDATGVLSVMVVEAITVDLTTAGVLDTRIIPQYAITPEFDAAGLLTTQVVEVEEVAAGCTAVGVLDALVRVLYAVPVGFSADGALGVDVRDAFLRQRVNKSGNYAAPRNSRVQVPGWSSDGAYPAEIVSDGLVIAGGGPCTIDVSISRSASTDSMTIFVMLSGVEIRSFSVSSSGSTTWTGTVVDGDRITLEVTATGGTTARRTIDGGYLEVVPA